MSSWFRLALPATLTTALLSTPALAAEPDTARPHGVVGAVRLTLPYYAFTSIDGRESSVNRFGLSGGATIADLWSAELGLALQGHADMSDVVGFARFGVTPLLFDTEDEDGAWSLRGGPWLGYRIDRRSGQYDVGETTHSMTEMTHSMTEHLGLELTRWWPSQTGLDILVTTGLVLPFARSEDANWAAKVRSADDFHHAFDFRAEVGVAF